MAITESRPAQHDGEPPTGDGPRRARRHPWRRQILLGLGLLLTTAAVVLAVLAGTYQPLQFGGETGVTFPGLRTATGSTLVNTFGGREGDWYIPPQSRAFAVVLSLSNAGPEPVTIEAVSMLSPQQREDQVSGLLASAGRPLWMPMTYRPGQAQAARPVAGLSLAPGQDMVVGIPVRMSGICYDPGGFAHLGAFYVKERFGFFTHWVVVRFQPGLTMHSPSPTRGPGTEPARDLICPAGASR
jgi:hypothetical protein